MEYLLYEYNEDYDSVYKDKNHNKWGYYSNAKIAELDLLTEPAIKEITGKMESCDTFLIDEYNTLKLSNPTNRSSFFYKIDGYMECKDDQGNEYYFIRVWKKRIAPLISALLLATVVLTGGTFAMIKLLQDNGPKLDSSAVAYKMPEGVGENSDPNSIMIPGFGSLTMKANTSDLYSTLVNPSGNQCYFRYELRIHDTQELIYRSDLIKPGMAITNVKLLRTMEAGEYDIDIIVKTADLDDVEKELNGGEIAVKLIAR